jgi:hypothetical protein
LGRRATAVSRSRLVLVGLELAEAAGEVDARLTVVADLESADLADDDSVVAGGVL